VLLSQRLLLKRKKGLNALGVHLVELVKVIAAVTLTSNINLNTSYPVNSKHQLSLVFFCTLNTAAAGVHIVIFFSIKVYYRYNTSILNIFLKLLELLPREFKNNKLNYEVVYLYLFSSQNLG
jgi:hypothetical protein